MKYTLLDMFLFFAVFIFNPLLFSVISAYIFTEQSKKYYEWKKYIMQKKRKIELKKPKNLISSYRFRAEGCKNTLSVSFCGVKSILDFNDTFISLKMQSVKIEIYGKNLEITVFENRNIGICGVFERIEWK